MQINWSVLLNVLLLTGVMVSIIRMLKTRRFETQTKSPSSQPQAPSVGFQQADKPVDDIIAVRKITPEVPTLQPVNWAHPAAVQPKASFRSTEVTEKLSASDAATSKPTIQAPAPAPKASHPISADALVIFLLAKERKQLAGYELLQTILSAGLRFGDGQLFHRHQFPNGQGPVLCSLATATESGVFDLQNMGAFSVHGLCLFMQPSGSANIDQERFTIMLDTAKQLSEGLNTHVLDDERKTWSDRSEQRYLSRMQVVEIAV